MKKFYLSIEQRKFIIEATLRLASELEAQGKKDDLKPGVRDSVDQKVQEYRQLANLLKVEEMESD